MSPPLPPPPPAQDTAELRSELVRKDELIRKHYDKLGQVIQSKSLTPVTPCLLQWQNMLADVQGVQASPGPGQGGGQAGGARPGQPGPGGPGIHHAYYTHGAICITNASANDIECLFSN